MGLKDELTDLIIKFQDYGLEINEDKRNRNIVSIETHSDLLNILLGVLSKYRNYVEEKETFLSEVGKLLNNKPGGWKWRI